MSSHLVPLDGVADCARQRRALESALDQVVLRAQLQRLHRPLLVVEAGEDDDRQVGRALARPQQRVEALAVGQAEVEQDDVEISSARRERRRQRRCQSTSVAARWPP